MSVTGGVNSRTTLSGRVTASPGIDYSRSVTGRGLESSSELTERVAFMCIQSKKLIITREAHLLELPVSHSFLVQCLLRCPDS